MRRRAMLATSVCCLGVSGAARALGADAALVLVPESRPRLLQRFTPAGGPLERHTGRPGAWYALLYLPMAPAWPLQLMLWSSARGHGLRLFALDAAPDEAPTVVDPLPLETEISRVGGPPRLSSRFVLPDASTAAAIFVLVEQWRSDGEPPAPLWVQLLSQRGPQPASTPWWVARDAAAAGGTTAPPSPLTQQARGASAHEVPIMSLPAAPESGVWR